VAKRLSFVANDHFSMDGVMIKAWASRESLAPGTEADQRSLLA
jgi:hypothetical protein